MISGPRRPGRIKVEKLISAYELKIGLLKGLHGEKYDPALIAEDLEFITPNQLFYLPDEYHIYVDDEEEKAEFVKVSNDLNKILNEIKFLNLTDNDEIIIEEYNKYYEIISYTHVFVTIRPQPGTEFKDFYNKVVKAISKKWITEYTLVFEQKGENIETIGDGFHVHFVCNLPANKKHSKVRDEFYNTFKSMCNKKCIDLSPIKDKRTEHVLKYMGYDEETKDFIYPNTYDFKNHESKFRALPFDEKFREKNQLKNMYINNLQ